MKYSYSEVTESGSVHDCAPSSLTGCPLSHLSPHLAPDVPDEEKPVIFTRLEINYKNDTNV